MKTITLQLYTFDELSEEVQKEIIERERWNIMDQCMEAYGSDYVTSLRTFEKLTNTQSCSWSVNYSGYNFNFKYNNNPIFECPIDCSNDIYAEELCGKLYDGKGYGTVFTDANGDAVIDYLKQWDSDEWTDDDIRSEEPRWVNNGTDSVHQKDGYTLIYNSTIGGVYMLYREANAAEIEWYNKLN